MSRKQTSSQQRRSPSSRVSREERVVKEKFLEQRQDVVINRPLVPMNEKQRDYMEKIEDYDLILATGYAGSSKTYIPTVMACDAYRKGEIKKIVFTRPNISNSKSLGYFSGNAIEKLSQWLMPVMSILRKRLGDNTLELAIKRGDIEFIPMEVVKGYSAEDCMFICDEAEDLTREEAKKLVTRAGKGCTMVLCGDLTQSELSEESGLKMLVDMAWKYPHLDVGLVDFNHINDIVRGEQVKQWILAFNKEDE